VAPSSRNAWIGVGTLYITSTIACHGKEGAPVEIIRDDAAVHDAAIDAPMVWPELARFPAIAPLHVVALPVKSAEPRFDVVGPTIAGGVAVVGGSQLGFVAVDWRSGAIVWRKQAGSRVAPPVVVDGGVALIGDCPTPPEAPGILLGCLRVVTPTGSDVAYLAIHGDRSLQSFATAAGPQRTWLAGPQRIGWRRGDDTVAIDATTGVATTASITPSIAVAYKDKTWTIAQDAELRIVAKGTPSWQTQHPYTQLLGAVYLPDQGPMVRAVNAGSFAGTPEIIVSDLDATGSLHGQVAFPVPGIAVLGAGVSAVGDAAIAVRLDSSLRRDFIVGYAANALLMWVYPLPSVPRVDPVGVAVAPEAVVVFHDGDTVTLLPELSAPPTVPGAIRAPSENATP
jgi:hypothetical protein